MSKIGFTFGPAMQSAMLGLMVSDMGFAAKVVDHIPVDRLYSEAHKYLFNQIKDKMKTTGKVPSFVEIEDRLSKVEKAKRKILREFCKAIYDNKVEDPEYVKERMTDYARKNAFVQVFQDAQTLWNSKQHEEAYHTALQGLSHLYEISFKDDATITVGDFERIRQQYLFEASLGMRKVPTNIGPLDEILNGGLEKGELGILLAEPKKGKSIGLIHMGAIALQMRTGRVAHFVLEGTTEQTVMRYQSRLSGIPYHRLAKDDLTPKESRLIDRIGPKYLDNLELVPFNQSWNYTTLDIESKLNEMTRRGRKPDLVVIDYADLVKGSAGRYESIRMEQTEVYREIKRMAMIHKTAIWTACLDGDTKIHTLWGHIPIKDLVGEVGIPVYAFNHRAGRVEVQTIEKVFRTSEAAEVWEVELDNGEKIRMTPNHRLMLRNGEYRELRDCQVGDSLMPLYQHIAAYGANRKERYTVLNTRHPSLRARESRMVADWKLGRKAKSSEHAHHKDHNPLNNHPDNIEIMSNADHKRMHMLESNWMKTKSGKDWWKKNNCQLDPGVRTKTSEGMKKVWAERKRLGIRINTRPDNHKIVSIKPCPIYVPTYNMTVTPSHNYALSAGIIVKNSQAKRPEDSPEKAYLLRAKDISESFEKVRIADMVCTLNQTPKERDQGILRLHVDIYRSNDTDKTISMISDFRRMIFHSRRLGHIERHHAWMVRRKS